MRRRLIVQGSDPRRNRSGKAQKSWQGQERTDRGSGVRGCAVLAGRRSESIRWHEPAAATIVVVVVVVIIVVAGAGGTTARATGRACTAHAQLQNTMGGST